MHIILASQSPRRKELLDGMGISFVAIASDFDEQLDSSRSAEEVAVELALGKARAIASMYPDALVVGSDTIVTDANGTQLGKAASAEEELAMLRSLCGSKSKVVSSAVIVCESASLERTAVESVDVVFRPYEQVREALDAYVASNDWQDKAVYGIQSGAAPLIDHISGNYDTILGLPTHSLARLLAEVGVIATPVELRPPVIQL